MKIEGAERNAEIGIIGLQHGDEPLGKEVVDRFLEVIDQYPGLQLILANEEAAAEDTRFIDCDLNRSYPGNPDSKKHEERLAAEMLEATKGTRYLIDIHTTENPIETEDGIMNVFPIIVEFDAETEKLIAATNLTDIAWMNLEHGGGNSGLGNMEGAGIALEYHKEYGAQNPDQIYAEIRAVVERILAGEIREPTERHIFNVTELTQWVGTSKLGLINFSYNEEIGGYSVLPRGKSYRNKHRGFTATERIDVEL